MYIKQKLRHFIASVRFEYNNEDVNAASEKIMQNKKQISKCEYLSLIIEKHENKRQKILPLPKKFIQNKHIIIKNKYVLSIPVFLLYWFIKTLTYRN